MIATKKILGLSLLPLCRGADLIAVGGESTSVSVSVTVTVDWLYPPDEDYASSASNTESASWTTESTSSWEGWGPSDSYSPPSETSSSWSSVETDEGVCPPYTTNSSTTSSEGPEKTTLITIRTVTITTVTTEIYSTADVEESWSSVAGAVYPVPSWTRCPHANDAFSCGGEDEKYENTGAAAVFGKRTEDQGEDEDDGSSGVDDHDWSDETEVILSAAASLRTEAMGSCRLLVTFVLVMGILVC